jgi:hypothetical protein
VAIFRSVSPRPICLVDPLESLRTLLWRSAISVEASPRAYAQLPTWAMAGGRAPELIDARLLPDALWLLRRYQLRVTAAREPGHNTHGDGTALDLVPAAATDQAAWDASAGALARALGWTATCAASGSRPVCALVPAIQFIGYDGYPRTRLTARLRRELPRAPARLLGLTVLRQQRTRGPMPLRPSVPRRNGHTLTAQSLGQHGKLTAVLLSLHPVLHPGGARRPG